MTGDHCHQKGQGKEAKPEDQQKQAGRQQKYQAKVQFKSKVQGPTKEVKEVISIDPGGKHLIWSQWEQVVQEDSDNR